MLLCLGSRRYYRSVAQLVWLASIVQTTLDMNPFGGYLFVFRSKRGRLIKVLCGVGHRRGRLGKRFDRDRFDWPQATAGGTHLSAAQLSVMLEDVH